MTAVTYCNWLRFMTKCCELACSGLDMYKEETKISSVVFVQNGQEIEYLVSVYLINYNQIDCPHSSFGTNEK